MQIHKQHAAFKPALLARSMPGLYGQRCFSYACQACHGRHHHRSRVRCRIQQPGDLQEFALPPTESGNQRWQLR